MMSEGKQIKSILHQLASNVATCAATIQAIESYAKREGWNTQELKLMHEATKQHLHIVFDPLFDLIDGLEDRHCTRLPRELKASSQI